MALVFAQLSEAQFAAMTEAEFAGMVEDVMASASAIRSGANVVTTAGYVGADHFSLTRDGVDLGTTATPYTDTAAAFKLHTYVWTAYDAGNHVLAQETVTYYPPVVDVDQLIPLAVL